MAAGCSFVHRRIVVPFVRMKIVDVLIIGGGLAGCALAWRLAQRGLEALLVERHGARRRRFGD